jgi:hypothetical protein
MAKNLCTVRWTRDADLPSSDDLAWVATLPSGVYHFLPAQGGNSVNVFVERDPAAQFGYAPVGSGRGLSGETNPTGKRPDEVVLPPTPAVTDPYLPARENAINAGEQADWSEVVTGDAIARAVRRQTGRDSSGKPRTVDRAATAHGVLQARKARATADEIGRINRANAEAWKK